MNLRNTTTTFKSLKKLQRADLALKTLVDGRFKPTISYLQEHGNASFLDLTIHTKLDSDCLEHQLEVLRMIGLIRQESSIFNTCYIFRYLRFRQILQAIKRF